MSKGSRRGLLVVAAIAGVLVVGTVGYMLIQGWGFLDSLYMTVITIFTVGFNEVHPLSTAGHVFTILLILGGVGTILYGLGAMFEFVVSGQLTGAYRRRAVKRQVEKLRDHYIICGFGRVGESVAGQFSGSQGQLCRRRQRPGGDRSALRKPGIYAFGGMRRRMRSSRRPVSARRKAW